MKNKVLIAGLGSVGTYLAEHLANKGYEVHGTSRKLFKNPTYQVHQCDLNDFSTIFRLLKQIQPDYVFNAASNADVRYSFDSCLSLVQNNVSLTLNLFEAIRLAELDPIICHISTSEVLGNNSQSIPMDENFPINPSNLYSISKYTQEQICKYYINIHHSKIILTRAFSYINPRRHNIFTSAFARQIIDIEQGKSNQLAHGNLHSVRSLCDVRDICEAYLLTVLKGHIGEIYHIGSTTPISVGEALDWLISISKVKVSKKLDETLLRRSDVTHQVPDITKFEKCTGWKRRYSLTESFEWLLETYRTHA